MNEDEYNALKTVFESGTGEKITPIYLEETEDISPNTVRRLVQKKFLKRIGSFSDDRQDKKLRTTPSGSQALLQHENRKSIEKTEKAIGKLEDAITDLNRTTRSLKTNTFWFSIIGGIGTVALILLATVQIYVMSLTM